MTDVSRKHGLGYVLTQTQQGQRRLIQCGSRFVTDTESRYSATEIELCAVQWVMKKCRLLLLGSPKPFKLVVNHQALVTILDELTLDAVENPRLQRMKERLMQFHFTAVRNQGKSHAIPDALSRAPVAQPTTDDIDDHYVGIHHIRAVLRGQAAELSTEADPAEPSIQLASPSQTEDPPKYTFQDVSMEIINHAGNRYLVYVDRLSGWPFVDECRNRDMKTSDVKAALCRHFAFGGIPTHIRTDGGLQFASSEFRDLAEEWGFMHTMSSSPPLPSVERTRRSGRQSDQEPTEKIRPIRPIQPVRLGHFRSRPSRMAEHPRTRRSFPSTNPVRPPTPLLYSNSRNVDGGEERRQDHLTT